MPNVVMPFPLPAMHFQDALGPVGRPHGTLLAVEHDGRVYFLAALQARLPNHVLDYIDALVPQTAQETLDLVVQHWPKLAKAAAGSA